MRAPSESSKLGALSTLSELSSALPSDASSVPNDSLSDLPRELPAAHGAHQVGQSVPLNELRSNASSTPREPLSELPSELQAAHGECRASQRVIHWSRPSERRGELQSK